MTTAIAAGAFGLVVHLVYDQGLALIFLSGGMRAGEPRFD